MDKYEDTSKDNEKLKQKVENMEKVLQSNQKEIKTLKDLLKNEVEIHPEKEVNISKCGICGKEFGSKSKMKEHIKKSH